MAKRVFDVVCSAIGLALLGTPMLMAALWVRLDSPGPVLFRQTRVGYLGREFDILKFRSMRVGDGGPSITVEGDSRITRAGRFLRKYKIDEFPQLINVLLGDMSFVGPRPEVPEYAHVYPEQEVVWAAGRPGITDPVSVRLRNESELLEKADDPERWYREVLLPQKTAGYLEYVRRRGFLYDLTVIGSTLWRVVSNPEGDQKQ